MDPGRPEQGHQTTVHDAHIMGKNRGRRNIQTTTEKLHMGYAGGNSGQTAGLRPVDYNISAARCQV